MQTGTIVTWFERRRFGFILIDGSKEEIFLHPSDCIGFIPNAGLRVQFEIIPFGGRTKASKVTEVR